MPDENLVKLHYEPSQKEITLMFVIMAIIMYTMITHCKSHHDHHHIQWGYNKIHSLEIEINRSESKPYCKLFSFSLDKGVMVGWRGVRVILLASSYCFGTVALTRAKRGC